MSHRLLLIEETPSTLETALGDVAGQLRLVRADWSSFFPEALKARTLDLIVAVAVPLTAEARGFFQWLHDHPIITPTLAVLPGEVEPELLRTVAETADDFILWPLRTGEWVQRVGRLLGPAGHDIASVRSRLMEELGLATLVGQDPTFLRTIERIPVVARSGSPVLITGETGTGKELCARAIHHVSKRRNFPFIPVDCGAVPDHLFENELFGHVRGAFTDAHSDQRGLIAVAEGGTLFLDEIDSLSLAAQTKLLRFLQERTYKPLGADRFVRADVNVIAATNQDLEARVRDRGFRSDLYYRLNVLPLHLTPLRERRGDIEILARHFVEALCFEAGAARKSLTPASLRVLTLSDWPGNVRELFNVIHRAVLFCQGTRILPMHVSVSLTQRFVEPANAFRQARAQAIEHFERLYVEALLRKHSGNVTRAAREAQKDRRAFGRLIKKYSIDRRDTPVHCDALDPAPGHSRPTP